MSLILDQMHQSVCGFVTIYDDPKNHRGTDSKKTKSKVCKICNSTFSAKRERQHHHDEIHRKRRFVCSHCNENIFSHKNLASHASSHRGQVSFHTVYDVEERKPKMRSDGLSSEDVRKITEHINSQLAEIDDLLDKNQCRS